MFYYNEGEIKIDNIKYCLIEPQENNKNDPSNDTFSKDYYSSIQKKIIQKCRKTKTRGYYNMIYSYYSNQKENSNILNKMLRRKYNK